VRFPTFTFYHTNIQVAIKKHFSISSLLILNETLNGTVGPLLPRMTRNMSRVENKRMSVISAIERN